ncbi:MAG: DUF2325 domain-containing protein [Syntrophomonadaceae bacterium]|nr:DUF2325 domain-containing protein [Syntrophomonadaceae bacterium]
MTVLVIGADRLGNIPRALLEKGAKRIIHWSGRNKSFHTRIIPKNVDVIILFCDFLNHALMYSVKRQAKATGIPIVFKKRSLTHKAG